jgi:hypothetical protein
VSAFEDLIFVSMVKPVTMEPEVAAAVATKVGVLSSLGTLRLMEKRRDDRAAAFVRAFGWVSSAWDEAVEAAGLSLSDYAAVRAFKGNSNESFHTADNPQQALQVLEGNTPVPEDMQAYT